MDSSIHLTAVPIPRSQVGARQRLPACSEYQGRYVAWGIGSEWKGNGRSAGEQLPQRNGLTSMASGTILFAVTSRPVTRWNCRRWGAHVSLNETGSARAADSAAKMVGLAARVGTDPIW